MLGKLSRDYWPESTEQPFVRFVLAMLGGPMVVVPLALLLALGVDFLVSGDLSGGRARVFSFAPTILVGSMAITLTLGLIAFLLLWALRLRGIWAYILAGFVVGLIAALAAPLLDGGEMQQRSAGLLVTLCLVFGAYFACIMLAIRWVAGIRV